MPIYEVRSIDAVGNPVDGYEVNDTREVGEVYIPPNGDAIQALFEFGILGPEVYGMYEAGEIQATEDDSIQISETETVFVASDGTEDGSSEDRYLDPAPHGMAETPRVVRPEPRFNRACRAAAAKLEKDEILAIRSGERPIYDLYAEPINVDEDNDFHELHLTMQGGTTAADKHELVINVAFVQETNSVQTEVVALNEDGQSEDQFEWSLEEWRRRPSLGFDPFTSEEIRPSKQQYGEIMVALDQHLEET